MANRGNAWEYRVAMRLDEFNTADAASAAATVGLWAAIPEWVDAIVAARPYGSVDELAATAQARAEAWTDTDLDAALAHHPRIGRGSSAPGAEAEASRREQAAMTDAAPSVAEAIAAGNIAYEERFGRVFLIRAAGRSPEEMLLELERRLRNDRQSEASEALGQLAEIAILRLRSSVTESEGRTASETTPAPSERIAP